ncbi:HsdM family class I SAM-dependent methyltransferase [Burkholderia glumae]|uniref:HsdM family class I SAM-dependent methyltransferase n=1 Tax=Burkholderia glumae TaxID=337 RepID=UPI0021507DB0|nr:N-6 DNA methylase [Burkholderia glumae]
MVEWLADIVDQLGVPRDAFIGLRETPTARHLRYMDLMSRPQATAVVGLPEGVVEVSGKAALYVVRDQLMAGDPSDTRLVQLMRTLACRADAAYLAVVSPATTTIYQVGFYREGELPTVDRVIDAHDAIGLRNLINGQVADSRQAHADRLWLDDVLFKLLTESAEALRSAFSTKHLSDGDVLSLIGRALFTRFLVDRDILKSDDIATIVPGAQRAEVLFADVDNLVATFQWLDQIFNGDLLDLGTKEYRGFLERFGSSAKMICDVLSAVMSRASGGQLSLDWDGLRFQHIPVDVLSQVYEHFAHRFMPEQARKTSIHYTPRGIAELLVDGVFGAMPEGQRHRASVLDPAAGAGVFLVLAFRRLVAEHWLYSGKRPRRATIRRVLTQQLCGLDINPTSIKVAALSLYLAALELDPQPQPLGDLRFERLFDSTLRCVDQAHLDQAVDSELGSLSSQLRSLGPFDIVLANPPWTGLPGRFKKLLDQIPREREEKRSARDKSLVPNQWPDMAFMWRSTQWCRPGGVIGLLVHARLLSAKRRQPCEPVGSPRHA